MAVHKRRNAGAGTAEKRKGQGRPIFLTIFAYVMIVVIIEVILLSLSIAMTNVSGRLNQNAKDILTMQVDNRVSYLEDLMQRAQHLNDLSEYIDGTLQQMLVDGTVTLDGLNASGTESDALLVAIAPELVSTMRSKSVTGIFVVLNTLNLHNREVGSGLPGIYLRDLDPDARPSENNSDLFIERGSASVVKKLGITTDKSWQPVLRYQGLKGNGFFKTPFQKAYEDKARLDDDDYGRWTTSVYKMVEDDRTAMAYSQPLILPDGTVYGVVGVEILTSYLQEKLPYTELRNDNDGSYFLVSTENDVKASSITVSKSVTSSEDVFALESPAAMLNLSQENGEYSMTLRRTEYYVVQRPINLYNRNAPFSHEQWLLLGAVRKKTLFSFTAKVTSLLRIAMLVTLVLGALSSLLVARTIAHPAELLYREVIAAQEAKNRRNCPAPASGSWTALPRHLSA